MVNRKLSRILGPVLGVMGFMLTIVVGEITVLAEDSVQVNSTSVQSTALAENKDYFINVNKSSTQNGIKVTVDKIAASKHKLKVVVKLENEKAFDKNNADNLIQEISYGENQYEGKSTSYDYPDDKTILITNELESREKDYPEKGEVRVDVVMPEYRVNLGIDVPVDFTEIFKKTIEKDISAKFKFVGNDFSLGKLEFNTMGASINYSQRSNINSEDDNFTEHRSLLKSPMILEVGDRMYKMRSSGSRSKNDGDNIRVTTGKYETEAVKYDNAKDEKNIRIIPIICEMSSDEMDSRYKEDKQNDNGAITKELDNNISYVKYFEFNNGNKGEIYNIDRSNGTVKIYCKGTSKAESLLMASNMRINYEFIKDQDTYVHYDLQENMSFYKDSEDSLGYIIEFNNVEKDKAVKVSIDSIAKNVDKYKIGDEIQISK